MAAPWEAYQSGTTATPPPPKPPPKTYESTADFKAQLDKTFGAGKWRDTSDYRPPWHNYAVGGVADSAHMAGTPDAPGAHDIVVPGMTSRQVAERLKGLKSYPEQSHLHVYSPTAAPPWDKYADAQPTTSAPAAPPRQNGAPSGDPTSIPQNTAVAFKRRAQESASPIEADTQRLRQSQGPWMDFVNTGRLLVDVAQAPFHLVAGGLGEGVAGTAEENVNRAAMKGLHGPWDEYASARRRQQIGDIAETAAGVAGAHDAPEGVAPRTKDLLKGKAGPGVAEQMRQFAATHVSPEHVSDISRAAAALHRSVLGKWGTTADKESYLLSHHARALRTLTPEQNADFIDYVERRSQGGPPPDAPPRPDVSTRVSGARKKVLGRIQDMAENTPLRKSADAIRALADRYKARIQYVLGTEEEGGPHFIQDYYAHLWKQKPEEVEAAMAQGSKQGSGANLRKRSVPTYAEGLERGLTPRYENPIDAMTAYNENMAKFLATHDIKNGMVERGLASWHRPGQQPVGWVPLDGKLAERQPHFAQRARKPGEPDQPNYQRLPAPGEPPRPEQQALPPPGGPETPGERPAGAIGDQGGRVAGLRGDVPVARPREPPGSRQVGDAGQPLQIEDAAAKARRVESEPPPKPPKKIRDRGVDKEVLYAHPDAARIYNNNISRGLNAGDSGPVYRGTRAVVNSLVQLKLGLSAFHAAVIGQEGIVGQLAQAIGEASRGKFKTAGRTALTAPLAPIRLAAKGSRMAQEITGVRAPSEFNAKLNDLHARSGGRLSMDRIYSPRASGSFFGSLKRGTFKRDLLAAGKRIYGENPEGGWDRAKGAVDLAGNLIQTAAAPIFESYIPAVKRGAWSSRMHVFMQEHPNAADTELEKYGRQVLDSVDNRFGELMHDNLFWKRSAFQIAQLVLLSPGWDIGTAREIGGGVANIPKSMKGLMTGKGIDEKTAYVAALVGFTSLQNAVATYLHTGQAPTGMDYFAYRTGGTNPDGSPERAMIPGYMKDVLGVMFQGPQKELANKLNPGLETAWQLYNDQDYRGYPISAELPGERGVGDYLLDQASPISLGRSSQPKEGSGLTEAERLMSIRPAPAYLQNPERRGEQQAKHDRRMHRMKMKADNRQAAEYAP